MKTQQITLEKMTSRHLDDAWGLSRQVQWPHRREDWELVLSISQGIVACAQDRVVGTAITTAYGDDTATINSVIVDAAQRGRGLGRTLVEEAIGAAGERSCSLIATQDGLPLYEKLDFIATGEIVQHQGAAAPVEAPEQVRWSEAGDFTRLTALDRTAFGHDRSSLMRALDGRARFAVLRDAAEVQAFGAIRPFGRGLVIGPVVARNDTEAKAVIDFLLASHQGSFVRIDTDLSTGLAEWLIDRGLAYVDSGVTMHRPGTARTQAAPAHHRTYALASQALG